MKCISIYEQKMRTGKLLSVIYKNIRKNQISRKEPNKTCARLYMRSLPRMAGRDCKRLSKWRHITFTNWKSQDF